MLRVRQIVQAAVIAIFVAWVPFGTWYSWHRFLSNHNYTTAEEQKETKEGDQELAIQRDIAKFNHQLVIATWAICVVGGITGIVLFFTLRATRQAAEHIPRVERAYLFPKIIDIQGSLERRRSSLNVCAENVGKTPGFVKLVTVSFFEHRPGESFPHYPDARVQLLDRVVSAGTESTPLFPDPIIVDRALPFFCAGCIEYIDIFRNNHTSRFLVRIDPLTREVEPAGRPAWNDWN